MSITRTVCSLVAADKTEIDGSSGRRMSAPGREALGTSVLGPEGDSAYVYAMLCTASLDGTVLCLGAPDAALLSTLARRFRRVTVCAYSAVEEYQVSAAVRSVSAEGGGNVQLVTHESPYLIPHPESDIDFILIHASRIPSSAWRSHAFWSEVVRVLKTRGQCFVSMGNPWHRGHILIHALRGILRLRSPHSVRKMARHHDMECVGVYGLVPNPRTPQLVFDLADHNLTRRGSQEGTLRASVKSALFRNRFFSPAFGVAIRKSRGQRRDRTGSQPDTIIDGVLAAIENLYRSVTPRRIEVRRSGRVVILAHPTTARECPVLIKLPYRPATEMGDQRNAEALTTIHSSGLVPGTFKRLVPRHLASGQYNGQPFYVEEAIRGVAVTYPPRPGLATRLGLPSPCRESGMRNRLHEIGNALIELHGATRQMTQLTDGHLAPAHDALHQLRTLASQSDFRTAVDRIHALMERELCGHRIPLTWSHGDAGLGNLLQNRHRKLCGIVDWENFSLSRLPLFDWVVLSASCWKDDHGDARWELLADVVGGKDQRFFEGVALDDYLRAMRIPRDLVAPLSVAAWLEYIGPRLAWNRQNGRWMQKTVFNVLEAFARYL